MLERPPILIPSDGHDALEENGMTEDPKQICRKWIGRIGVGFHPDTRGKDYDPVMGGD